jgi:transcriptional regulator with XRE-family HTH domain
VTVDNLLVFCYSMHMSKKPVLTLREHRDRQYFTLRALSQLSGVSPSTISLIETGKRENVHQSTIRAIAGALEVHPSRIKEFNLDLKRGGSDE